MAAQASYFGGLAPDGPPKKKASKTETESHSSKTQNGIKTKATKHILTIREPTEKSNVEPYEIGHEKVAKDANTDVTTTTTFQILNGLEITTIKTITEVRTPVNKAGAPAASPPAPAGVWKQSKLGTPGEAAVDLPASTQQATVGAPVAAPAAPPQELEVTFVNMGSDPAFAQAELYYETTRWGPLGHGDPPVVVGSYQGHRWFLVVNGVYAKQFDIGPDAKQTFSF